MRGAARPGGRAPGHASGDLTDADTMEASPDGWQS